MNATLCPWERPGAHCIGSWVNLRVGLDGCGKLATTAIRSQDRPVRSESLYRLSYRGPPIYLTTNGNGPWCVGKENTRIYVLTQEIAQWGIHYTCESCGLYNDINVIMPAGRRYSTRNTGGDLSKMCSSPVFLNFCETAAR